VIDSLHIEKAAADKKIYSLKLQIKRLGMQILLGVAICIRIFSIW